MSVSEAAERLGVDESTVRRWLRAGQLKAWRMGNRGKFHIYESDVERLKTGGATAQN